MRALRKAWRRAGQHTLRITTQEDKQKIVITLEGRVAGPWVAELSRVWVEMAPRISSRKLWLDLRNVTYADGGGRMVLGDIYIQTRAGLITSTPWTEYLAGEIRNSKGNGIDEEVENGSNS